MSPSTRRLLKEAAELNTHPSPHFHAAPISDDNLYDWHFTLQGPPAPSPYARGIYHGRIVLPSTYPLRPPSFRFLTPSGRFEVNREICLSISGHHEETWQPAWGIRTALIALRSFMDGDAKGQVGGLDVGEGVRRRYAEESRGWRCELPRLQRQHHPHRLPPQRHAHTPIPKLNPILNPNLSLNHNNHNHNHNPKFSFNNHNSTPNPPPPQQQQQQQSPTTAPGWTEPSSAC
ncbi:UBC-like protein [Aspergillus heteromorphus CBS 117.55]|uniref:UBC-like protein n=1 Tax=Aspergillus heteromorphus CBS 117.55 TaxID=1448321 RepID=A0A317WQZ1_9EURO|nr:UBC-like protein [Aspergillus heteromorphus CBS 117.55]PWY88924.1 UBC-like protein [Aspergillus heteromorphus CBS 117.55]